jgi:methionyl-tRNA formyltransferase
MRVLYMGTPAAAIPPLAALLASDHEVVAVATRPDKPRDRAGGRPAPSMVKLAAEKAGLPVLQPARGRDPDLPAQLAAFGADIGVACAFGLLLPRPVLDAFPRGVVNVHFSLLPAYRGAAPVQRALLDGVDSTGITIFQLDEGMDTGPILASRAVGVLPTDDAGQLTGRLAEVGARLLVETIDAIEAGTAAPTPQPDQGASLAPKVTVEEARLVLSDPASRLANAVRAFTPNPGAWTTLHGRRLKVLAATADGGGSRSAPAAGSEPGRLAVGAGGELLAATGEGWLRLDRVQPEGRRPMAGADFARGLRLTGDERLGS